MAPLEADADLEVLLLRLLRRGQHAPHAHRERARKERRERWGACMEDSLSK